MKTFLGENEILCIGLLCLIASLPAGALPAYSQTNYNSIGYSPDNVRQASPPTQQPRTSDGGRRTLQSMVRSQMDGLDRQTQNDLKILSYLENELNQIFSCYIRLSCPRTRSAKVLAECDELKDWPLYHQVMKMAGIRRYPYQNYAPQQRSIVATTTTPPTTTSASRAFDFYRSSGRRDVSSSVNYGNSVNARDDLDDTTEDEQVYERDTRHRPRRVRRGPKRHHQVVSDNEIDEQ